MNSICNIPEGIFAVGHTINMGTVFAVGGVHWDVRSDEIYSVQQKVENKQGCVRKNENEGNSVAVLANLQACAAHNLNDIGVGLGGREIE